MPPRNVRLHPRQASTLRSRLLLDWGELDGTIENIGEGGVFFVTDTLEGAVAEGDRLSVSYEDDGRRRRIPGVVLRVERYFHEGQLFRAFAVKFDPAAPPPAPSP